MPSLEFYAVDEDLEQVLNFVLNKADCRIFESNSQRGKKVLEFQSVEEIKSSYPLGKTNGKSSSAHLTFWPVGASQNVSFKVINPKSKPEDSQELRTTIYGWGLLHLSCGGFGERGISPSLLSGNSEKRALKWASTYQDVMGSPSDWDWKEVSRVSNALARYIRKISISKVGTKPVLPYAGKLIDEGIKAI